MSQQRVGAKEAQADVGGLGEVLQHRRVGEPFGAGPAVDQRHHNLNKHTFTSQEAGVCVCVKHRRGTLSYLSVLQGDDARVFCGADLVIVS